MRKKALEEELLRSLGMGTENKERRQQVIYYKTGLKGEFLRLSVLNTLQGWMIAANVVISEHWNAAEPELSYLGLSLASG